MRGLIILSPWIERIVSGEKVWELRPGSCRVREEIALLNSGLMLGTARVVGCIGPMSAGQLMRHRDKHRVPADVLRQFLRKWNGKAYAWVLADARALVHAPVRPLRPTAR
jgi:hypothetical protein